ncbi:MAG TPA: BON domain-containing protein [Longimicrobiaceae bacterium]
MRSRGKTSGPGESGMLLLGAAVGAALMYLLDPDRGRRRRARLRDQLVHGVHEAEHLGDATASNARHLRNQARGLVAETRSRLHPGDVDDSVLEGRLRAELGRIIQPVGDLRVEVEHGTVRVSGTATPAVEERVVAGLRRVPGVRSVESRLREGERVNG